MAFITFMEVVDLAVMTIFIGWIFSDAFRKRVHEDYDPLKLRKTNFNWEDFKFAIMVAAPAVILHEMGHKIVAMSYGLVSTFHAAYPWLGLGALLKLMNFGFIFFVPAYVSTAGITTWGQSAMISVAGPLVNLVLWLSCLALLKWGKISVRHHPLIFLTSRINMMLFFFNMLPIPPFDGYGFFSGLWHILF